jgi:hypothetical protein
MNKVKKPLSFKRVMLNYFKGFFVLVLISSIAGYLYLLDYQNNLPSNEANRVIKALETLDLNTLDEMSSNLPVSLLKPDIFSQYLTEFGDALDLYFYEGTSKIKNQVVFIFVNHDKKMASLTLEKKGKKSAFGFEAYKVLDLIFKPLYEYEIIVNTPVDVLINGISIDQQVQELNQIQNHAFDKAIFGDLPVSTYTFKDFQYITAVTVENHPEIEIIHDPLTKTYTVVARADQTLQDDIATYGEKVIKAHTRLLSIPTLSRNVFINTFAYPNSDFANIVKSYDLMVRYPFISESFDDLKIENIVQYSSNTFSVDVSISYTWTATWVGVTKTRVQHPAYTFYITNINGYFQVTDMTLLSYN